TLGEVVVNTALGFKKSAKSLSYSAQSIKPDELTTVKDGNFTNAITGKASNVTITQGSGGVGGATKIILRGNNSINGTGQPLIVIDGMPITNQNARPGARSAFGGTNLTADGLSSINPDDIDNLTVLKGPSAAALYGAQAANGAILITTKSGKSGVTRVDVSSNNTFSVPAYYPKTQTSYGGIDEQGINSWGAKISDGTGVAGLLKEFYQTQILTSNTVSLTAGNEKARVYTSYANTYGKRLIPNNNLSRHNFDIKGDINLFKNFLEVGAKVTYIQQNQRNPFSPGSYFNPLYTMNSVSANFPLSQYKNYASPTGWGNLPGVDGRNWSTQPIEGFQNPYWMANKIIVDDQQDRILAAANIKLNFTDYLNLQVRGTLDKMNDNYTNKRYVGTAKTLAGTNGHMQIQNSTTTQWYGDVLLNFNRDIVKDMFHVNALIGGSIRDYSNNGTFADAKQQMFFPNFFDISNFNFQQGAFTGTISEYDKKQIQSAFYSVEFSYKDALFLTHTGRNDWSSTLPLNKNNYYYPSIGASAVLTELIKAIQSPILNYLKVRLSYTQVGNDLPSFIINPIFTVTSTGGNTGYYYSKTRYKYTTRINQLYRSRYRFCFI
ncbi:MAG: TonB-dependent receptor plug domain-containing protein, partial [Chitinophagaceae bacterium]